MKKERRKAQNISKMLQDIERAEQILLVKRNKGLARNLKRYLKCKQRILTAELNEQQEN